ncbi:MAG: esterase [Frankiales bacterium]|nr:esterase [Frankiales bacterium]
MASWSLGSPWFAVPPLAVALVLMLRSAPRLGRHRGRALALLALLVAMAQYANSYFGYLPQAGDLVGAWPWPVATLSATGPHPRGAVVTLRISGARSGAPARDALVYLPPQYFENPSQRFPALYLLHGSPGVPLDWFRGGEAAVAGLGAARRGFPAILVAPRMSKGWLDDSECVDRRSLPAESYLVQDVVPTIDHVLRTRADWAYRGLAGNSAGGYCALSISLRHPMLFSKVAALSPLIRPTYAYGSLKDLFEDPPNLTSAINTHTPAWLLNHEPAARRVALRLDVGRQDPVAAGAKQLAQLDASLGGHPQVILRAGGHTFRVWRPALRDAVLWFAQGACPPQPSGLASPYCATQHP